MVSKSANKDTVNLRQFTDFSNELTRKIAIVMSPPEITVDIVDIRSDQIDFTIMTTRKGTGGTECYSRCCLVVYIQISFEILCVSIVSYNIALHCLRCSLGRDYGSSCSPVASNRIRRRCETKIYSRRCHQGKLQCGIVYC